ncbi:MAG: DEAD/DEAH box helicase [Planctomycetota bacterium]|nr:DEAD/DEAH box helicase [Planctomycetota bacterium]
MQFADLNLAPAILETLTAEGYTTPTPIQAKAIPPILEGKDVLGCAQTGTGKTAAFALPIIQTLSSQPVDKTRRGPILPRALILSPTRELATQIAESFATYGKSTHLTGVVIFGGVSQFHQVRSLQRGIDVLVATPGRLMDLMQQGHVNLTNISVFVLDEADRMLDMGFIDPIRRIAAALPAKRQTLMFSATMPRAIMHLADSLLRSPVKVSVTPVASAATTVSQHVYMVSHSGKQSLLKHIVESRGIERAIVFTRTKHGADRVTRRLIENGITADAIHGNKAQNARQRALDAFRTGRSRVLVATDVAARGIDVDGITHVFNFDIPHEPESYVHRIGRTGRAGASGIAISFCDREELGSLRDIERLTGKRVQIMTDAPEFAAAVPAAVGQPRAARPVAADAPAKAPRHDARPGPSGRRPENAPPPRSKKPRGPGSDRPDSFSDAPGESRSSRGAAARDEQRRPRPEKRPRAAHPLARDEHAPRGSHSSTHPHQGGGHSSPKPGGNGPGKKLFAKQSSRRGR